MLVDLSQPTADQWQKGWESTLRELTQPGTRLAMFGDIADWDKDGSGCLRGPPLCSPEMQCAEIRGLAVRKSRRRASRRVGDVLLYIPTMPWVCADRCESVIADIRVYQDRFHFTNSYTRYLTGAVDEALRSALT